MSSDDAPRPPDKPKAHGLLPRNVHRVTGLRDLPGRLLAVVRRDPHLARHGSMAAVAGGVALFVAAALGLPLLGSGAAAQASDDHAHQHVVALPSFTQPATSVAPTPTVTPTTSPTSAQRSKARASAKHGVISALASDGIPAVALNAYRVAAKRMAHSEPACGIQWWLIAGIGREESDHGLFGGAALHADGVSTPPIIGPALDGKSYTYIPAPSNGLALDGDAKYAHALGPMQFIPSTWATYGADSDNDGHANVFDIDDAALGTARYLCAAAGGDLRTNAAQHRAVFSYNHTDVYVAQVLALAHAYRDGISLTGIPVKGNTKGKVDSAPHKKHLPPADPGAPTATGKAAGAKHKPAPSKTATSAPKATASSASHPSSAHPKTSAPTTPAPSTSSPKPGTTTTAPKSTPTTAKPTSTSTTATAPAH